MLPRPAAPSISMARALVAVWIFSRASYGLGMAKLLPLCGTRSGQTSMVVFFPDAVSQTVASSCHSVSRHVKSSAGALSWVVHNELDNN